MFDKKRNNHFNKFYPQKSFIHLWKIYFDSYIIKYDINIPLIRLNLKTIELINAYNKLILKLRYSIPMKTLFCIITSCILMCSCAGSHTMSTKSSSSGVVHASGRAAKKAYESNKYHPSIKSFSKVNDVTTDAHKKSGQIKKANHSSSAKYKAKQAAYLRSLNNNNKYQNSKKNDAIFILY